MNDVSPSNFGLLIGFLLPGFMVLWGLSYSSATVRLWLSGADATPTVGGFMFVTLASVAAGVTVSTVRWAVLDTIHRWTGLPQPDWDFSRLQARVGAYNVLNDIHYKFYLFHGNALLALVFVYTARRTHEGIWTAPVGWFDLGFVVLSVILFTGSRDCLRKYHLRVGQLLGTRPIVDRPEAAVDTRPCQRVLPSVTSATPLSGPHNSSAQRSSRN
jgi:hypothetical protein